jgi:hypothetical protein
VDDRYRYDKEGPARCRICGGNVYEKQVEGMMSVADRLPPIETKRVCQNPICNSNTGDMSLADVV